MGYLTSPSLYHTPLKGVIVVLELSCQLSKYHSWAGLGEVYISPPDFHLPPAAGNN